MTTISGICRDAAGDPVAGRVVRVYTLGLGRLLGEAISSDGSTPQEPYFSDLQLLMSMDGSNNGTSFSDISSHARTVTRVGSVVTKTDKFRYGSASAYFDGTGDALTIGSAADWAFLHAANAKWTADCWVSFANTTTNQYLFCTSNGTTANHGIYTGVVVGGLISFQMYRGVSNQPVVSGTFPNGIPIDDELHHVRLTWDHTLSTENAKLWIDGKYRGALNKTANAPSGSNPTTTLAIGGYASGSGSSTGHIDEVKIYKDIILSTADFVPPQPLRNTVLGAGEYSIDCGSYADEVVVYEFDPADMTIAPKVHISTPV